MSLFSEEKGGKFKIEKATKEASRGLTVLADVLPSFVRFSVHFADISGAKNCFEINNFEGADE